MTRVRGQQQRRRIGGESKGKRGRKLQRVRGDGAAAQARRVKEREELGVGAASTRVHRREEERKSVEDVEFATTINVMVAGRSSLSSLSEMIDTTSTFFFSEK
ncbi:hypothetical protein BVRB_6g147320 [Beta vulgaris subsp. vulgaris]|nr:hypothetical protein BVRB_6g147320 [Beta vulgaris subsp. vulgaris]